MFIPLSPPLRHDETVKEIDLHLFKLENVVIQEYRRLLVTAANGLDQLLKFPAHLGGRFRQILTKLHRTLEGTGDYANLRIVTEQQEELRIRMLVLEHLLERDIPYAYLERAFNPAVHLAVFAHRGEGVAWHRSAAAEATGVERGEASRPRRWLTGLFRHQESKSATQRPAVRQTGAAGIRGSIRKWFENLPDYLKSLFLLHHFMEKDELRLLAPGQRAPSLGEEYRLYCGPAVFEATDLGEYHWRLRAERRRTERPKDEELARSLREKLAQRNYVIGTRSRFSSLGSRGNGAEKFHQAPPVGPARTPDELRRKLQHRAAEDTTRVSPEDRSEPKKPDDGTLRLEIDYTH